jgi:hypothetical protein
MAYKKSAGYVVPGKHLRMGNDGEYKDSIATIVGRIFKARDENRRFNEHFGASTSGIGRQSNS